MAQTRQQTSTGKGFHFQPFSRKQMKILTWWTDNSPMKDMEGIIADGSIRSGKTLSMSLSFVMWGMARFDGMKFGMCGKTIASLRRNVVSDLKRMLKGRGYKVKDRRSDNLLIIQKGQTINEFYLFGGRDESSYTLVQGITLAGVLFDEVALQPESFVTQAISRCSVTGSKHWFNCNPAERLHWFKVEWINKFRQKEYIYLHFTMDDNLSLSEAIKERYRNSFSGMFYRRYIEGLWVAAEGVIYDMWDDQRNLYTDDPATPYDDMTHRIAIDYGTTNPMVFLDTWDDGSVFRIRKEYYWDSRKQHRQKTDSEYADDLEAFTDGDRDVVLIIDPSAASFITECRVRGYRVKSADNDVSDGIRIVSTLMQRGRLLVERGCRNLLRERGSYIWDEKASQRGVEQPVKESDHAMDAMRYLCKTVMKSYRIAEDR